MSQTFKITSTKKNLSKIKVLFVGSFVSEAKDSSTGGQTFASISLSNSSLSKNIDWIKLDTTTTTNHKRPFFVRAFNGALRITVYIFKIIVYSPEFILLFAAHGWSFKEKSWMARIGKFFGKKIIFAPRSGIIENDLERDPKFGDTIIRALQNTDYLICQSNAWKDFYQRFRSESSYKALVINNWLDHAKYVNLPIKNRTPKNILFLGRVTENKGIFDLLDAFGPICETNDLVLSVAGQGESFDKLKQQVNDNNLSNRIKLLGWVHGQEKIDLLKSADMLVLPSYKEGYPNALLEAMAAGVSVIASNIGSIPEIIDHKINGYLIQPGNASDIRNAITWFIDNPDKKLSSAQKARDTIIQNNSIETAVSKFEEFLLA